MSVETTSEPRIPEAPDRDELVRLVSLYMNGFGLDKPEQFKEVFHRKARIFFIQPDGMLWGTTDHDWLLWEPEGPWATHFDGWASSADHPEGSHGRVIQVIQAGDVACVILAMGSGEPMLSGDIGWWVDIHTLLRIDGAWKVMAKTAAHASHGGWAGLEPPGTPATPDRDEIVRVANLYIDGCSSHSAQMIDEAFHPAAPIYFTNPDGGLHEELVIPFLARGREASAGRGHVEGRILQVVQAGDVAVVLLNWDGYNEAGVLDQPWVDFHTLLRLDGTWEIMAKTATHASRADWAGKA